MNVTSQFGPVIGRAKYLMAVVLCFVICRVTQAQFAEFPPGGGKITLVNFEDFDIVTAGFDFTSASGQLIPVPPGTSNAPADPFAFFLSNTPQQVTYGSLGATVTFPSNSCTELSLGAEAGADVLFTWGDGVVPVSFPVFERVSSCAVPEPAAGMLSGMVTLMLFAILRSNPRSTR